MLTIEKQIQGQQGVEQNSSGSENQVPYNESYSVKHVTPKQFRKVLDQAYLLQQADESAEDRRKAISRLEQDLQVSEIDEKGIQIAAMYRVATDLGLKPEYIKKAIELHHPTREQQIEDITTVNGQPSYDERIRAWNKFTKRYVFELLKRLRSASPEIRIYSETRFHPSGNPFLKEVVIKEVKKVPGRPLLLPWRKTKKVRRNLARLSFEHENIVISCESPLLLRACKDFIANKPNKLGYEICEGVAIQHNYDPNVTN